VAIDRHKEILKISAKDETPQRAGGNASPSVSIDDELSIKYGWYDQTKKHRKGGDRSNEQRAGDR